MTTKKNLFEYFLFKLIGWHCKNHGITLQEFNEHSTNNYSKLKVIKLHFFTCSTTDEALDYYDNFYAMPYGHVESDVYTSLNELENFRIDNFKLTITNLNQEFSEVEDQKRQLIEESVENLKNFNINIIDLSPFTLVELSHKWFSWQYTFNEARKEHFYSKKISSQLIKEEAKIYWL